MKEKIAYIVSCSDHYGFRLHIVDRYFKEQGYKVVYITSNFDHDKKESFKCKVEGSVQLQAKSYKKNLSVSRILSHRGFAKSLYKYLCNLEAKPDVLFVHIPPNYLAKYTAKFKKKYPEVKLIYDIFDLWPETFPSSKAKKVLAPIFKIWAGFRDKALKRADFIISECDLFRQKLSLSDKNSGTVYLCGKKVTVPEADPILSQEKLELCYLGSINNIISIPEICSLLSKLIEKKKVVLHIVGMGEMQDEFVDKAKETGAEVIFYGPIYDDGEKQNILRHCHFGLNVMKQSVCIGLTMKSVEYFRYGVPIINNIPADTQKMVNEHDVGVSLDDNCVENILSLTVDDCLKMRDNVKKVFIDNFTEDKICEKFGYYLNEIIK